MRKKIQHAGGCSKSGKAAAVGKLPSAQTSYQFRAHGHDTTAENLPTETAGGRERPALFVGKSRNLGGLAAWLNPVNWLLLLIYLYQKTVSPYLPECCRFTPTCSQYAVEALKVHGLWYGTLLVCWRLLRCQPFCKGGYDPVPPVRRKREREN